MQKINKIVLAYSGGLDTSVILRWLQEKYECEVICYTADLGQDIDRKKIIQNAKRLGVKKIIIEDLREIFVKDYVFPMIRGNALYEGIYLLGTSIARPLIAKRQIEIAKKYNAQAVSHGSTGKEMTKLDLSWVTTILVPILKLLHHGETGTWLQEPILFVMQKKITFQFLKIKKGLLLFL